METQVLERMSIKEHFPDRSSKLKNQIAGKIVNRFWQRGGGSDRNIYGGRALQKTIKHINYNPVRKSLAKNFVDWKWSSARFWEKNVIDPTRIDKIWFWEEENR